ncbi:Uncharacterised protein [Streptococcus pneumoniae]|nr:hypothetical protein [Streptococcus pneumoniae]CEW15119.1 Uncharacterised protein [Streptococcus pneumoniae]CEW69342.1 Uncharacterised protein [Streptococcus pneumoniae]CGF31611.1 Uncharacterised protein [Streptococcus pneumoniae]CJB20335.1 Uncharacterised protein [Streptococcus pneumoniae]
MGIYGRKTIAMKHFFAGIGEIHFLLFLLYPITSPIIGLVIGYNKNKSNKFYYYSSWYDIGINFGIIKSV